METWKSVDRFGGVIEVSDLGRVRRLPGTALVRNGHKRRVAGRMMKPRIHPYGYEWFEFSVMNKMYRDFGHRLVLEAFVGPCPEGHYGLHFDNDPKNNKLSNLRWGTQTENCSDKLMHGTQMTGEQIWWSKLKESQVVEMRCRRAAGERLASIAKDFGLSDVYVWHICTGAKWPNAGGPIAEKIRVVRALSEDEKLRVMAGRAAGKTIQQLATEFGVSRTQIHNLVRIK